MYGLFLLLVQYFLNELFERLVLSLNHLFDTFRQYAIQNVQHMLYYEKAYCSIIFSCQFKFKYSSYVRHCRLSDNVLSFLNIYWTPFDAFHNYVSGLSSCFILTTWDGARVPCIYLSTSLHRVFIIKYITYISLGSSGFIIYQYTITRL